MKTSIFYTALFLILGACAASSTDHPRTHGHSDYNRHSDYISQYEQSGMMGMGLGGPGHHN